MPKTKPESTEQQAGGAVTQFDPDFEGPVGKRSCRDVFFFLLFLLFLVGWGFLGWQAYTYGNPKQILYPLDSRGQACGFDNSATGGLDLRTKPFLFWLAPFNATGLQVCIESCPTTNAVITSTSAAICDYGVTPTLLTLSSLMSQGKCAAFTYATSPVISRCMPSNINELLVLANSTTQSTMIQVAMDGKETAMLIIGDFAVTWMWFLAFAGISLGVSLFWLLFMRFFTGFFVWVTAILGLIGLDAFAVFFYFAWQDRIKENATGGEVTDTMKRTEQTYMGLFIATVVIAAIANLIVLFLRKRIKLAVQVVKESVSAIHSMPLLLFFPIFNFLCMLVLLAYWIAVALFISSATTQPSIFGYSYDLVILKYLQWYNLFGLFWGHQFLSGVNQTTIAGAVATWYWARDKRSLPLSPVLKSFGRTIRYHLGSIAIGSLLIAIVQIIRVLIYQIQRQLRASKNKAAQGIMACLQCCFACVEKIMKFINRNAYIEIAIYGKSFCTSSKNAFQLLLRNAFRLVAIDSVAGFILFLGRTFVAALCGVGSHYWFKYYYASNPLSYQPASVLVVMIIGYATSGVFFYVVDMSIDTVFLCFCEDCERNDGSPERPFFMSERLMLLANVNNTKKLGTTTKSKGKQGKADGKVVKTREAFVSDM